MKIKINGKEIECQEGKSILETARENNIYIPTLCFQKGHLPEGRCRLCMVELGGKLKASCETKVQEGMDIQTHSERVLRSRRTNTELLMPHHVDACYQENPDHELCKVIEDVGIKRTRFKKNREYVPDLGAGVLRYNELCINCGRCVQTCDKIQATCAINFAGRGHHEHVTPYSEHLLEEVACTECGQCIASCPVGAIKEREHLPEVLAALKDKKKHVIVQTAPSIRASLGEEFGMKPGSLVTGKMVAALKKCGFDKVFDTNLGADMTIMEESAEFLRRVKDGGPFPMITTCCPAWIKFMEHFYHKLIPNMSSCKSPHEMLGVLIKKYYAKNAKIPEKDVVVVSVMPCTAKKYESTRPELKSGVDYVLTTREAAKLIKQKRIDFVNLEDDCFDPALGVSTGAGAVFGASGGVMEAALRTAYETGTGKELTKIEFDQLRGMQGVKEGTMIINGTEIKFAAANGLRNARELMKRKKDYHFIEIMACPGGCIGGGGQPLPWSEEKLKARMQAIYEEDAKLPLRKSHENPIVKKIYEEFLTAPLSKKAEKLLHTNYIKRGI